MAVKVFNSFSVSWSYEVLAVERDVLKGVPGDGKGGGQNLGLPWRWSMYSYEERVQAVRLYLKLGKRCKATLRQLGYGIKNSPGYLSPIEDREHLGLTT